MNAHPEPTGDTMDDYGAYDTLMAFATGVMLIGLGSTVRALSWVMVLGLVFVLGATIKGFELLAGFVTNHWFSIAVTTIGLISLFIAAAFLLGQRSGTKHASESTSAGESQNDISEAAAQEKFDQRIASSNLNQIAKHARSRGKGRDEKFH